MDGCLSFSFPVCVCVYLSTCLSVCLFVFLRICLTFSEYTFVLYIFSVLWIYCVYACAFYLVVFTCLSHSESELNRCVLVCFSVYLRVCIAVLWRRYSVAMSHEKHTHTETHTNTLVYQHANPRLHTNH